MENDQLKVLYKKCRCCLQNAKENERLEIGEIIREKFHDVTQFELSRSDELSQIICSNCFSILSQYCAMKKGFIERQNMLHDLLKRKEERKEGSAVYVKVKVIGEQHHNESKSENQKKKIESFYRVEEAGDEVLTKPEVAESKLTEIVHFHCSSCDRQFESKTNLKVHRKRVHLKSSDDRQMIKIGRTSLYPLLQNRSSNKFLCSQCGANFSRTSCLKRHINIVHKKIKRFECDICDYKCYKRESIRKHMATHLPQTERSLYKCRECPEKQFASIYTLKLHEKNFHNISQKNFKCTSCDRSFSREISLKEHVKFVHLKSRPIKCEHCEAAFASRNHLKRHLERKHK